MKKIIKRRLSLSVMVLFVFLLSACNSTVNHSENTINVVDCVGREVQVPLKPKAIATLDPFAGQTVIMLGFGDKMPATVNGVKRDMLLQSISPSLANSTVVKDSGSINAEAVLSMGIDLMFIKSDMYKNESEREKIEKLNVPYLVIDYNNMKDQQKAFMVIGESLGASEEAAEMVKYYNDSIGRVEYVVAHIPKEERPKLYHAVNEATRTDAEGSLAADWIGVTGAINVSLGERLSLQGEKSFATLEQIYEWDPHVIICSESGVDHFILEDTKWKGLGAVREKNVHQIPIGVSRWGHPSSSETPLAIMWLGKTLYPEEFKDLDIKAEIRYFYTTFFDYELSDETLDLILSGDGIRKPN